MPAVTISAGYGAGGSIVARAVAERLGYQLLDRAISSTVAAKIACTVAEAEGGELKRSFAERFFGVLAPMAGGVVGGADPDGALESAMPVQDGGMFRDQAERIIRAALPDGAVILGRAGAAALRDEPGGLRVRLFGPKAARVDHAAGIEGIDHETAARRLSEVDRARAHYVKKLYGCDIDEPSLYHLHLDSSVIPLETCADIVIAAFATVK